MLQEFRGPADAYRVMHYFNRIREFELSSMTHVCCWRLCPQDYVRLYDEWIKHDSKEIDEILEAQQELTAELNRKMKQSMRDQR